MNDILDRVWNSYRLATVQVDHPLRALCEHMHALQETNARLRARVSKLDDEATRMLRLARENGQLRDVAVRERDQAVRRAEAVERRWAAAADDRK